MTPITHIVIFKYAPSATDAEVHLAASRFLALQDECEFEGKRYLAVTGGRNNSTEGLDKGFQVRLA
jgi:predicted GTPase